MDERDHIDELRRALTMGGRSVSSKGNKRFHDGALLDAIAELGLKATEDEIAQKVFGETADNRLPAYVNARSRLKKRLLGLLGHLHFRTGSDLRRAIYLNGRTLFWSRTLVTLGARATAVPLLKRALQEAREFELTLNRVQCLEMLVQDSALRGKKTLYKKYDEELTEAFELALAERESRRYNELIDLEYAFRAGKNPAAEADALQYAERSRKLFENHPSFQTGREYYRMAIRSRDLANDPRGLIMVATQAEKFLEDHPRLSSRSYSGAFALDRVASSFHIGDLAGGLEAAKICERSFARGINNWFVAKQYEFLLSMHSRDFVRARQIYYDATADMRFISQPEHAQEKWLLFERYLMLMEGILTQTRVRILHNPTSRELFHEFTRSVPVYSKDKRGYNISLLILHFIYLLSTGNRGSITTRADALERYYRRYAQLDPESPTAGFIRALILLERKDFKLKSLGEEGERAKQLFLHGKEELEEYQVLPYPLLWEIILGLIDDLKK